LFFWIQNFIFEVVKDDKKLRSRRIKTFLFFLFVSFKLFPRISNSFFLKDKIFCKRGDVGATQYSRQVANLEQVGSLERGKPSWMTER